MSSFTAVQSHLFLFKIPKESATRKTCTSRGIYNCDGEIFFQIPKSTPRSGERTIHLRNIFNLFTEEFRSGDGTCFLDRKSTRLNSSHVAISYAVFCLKKKKCIYCLAYGVYKRHKVKMKIRSRETR